MFNKSKRNKSSKKKYRQKTKINYKYGGQQTQYGKSRFYADYPNATEDDIKNSIGFEIPNDPKFNPGKDNYKFLEMADRDLTTDMETKLNKYESGFTSYNAAAQYCKYMYLIRATHPTSGNTVLHYICNHRSVEMFQLVWPYYLILYNKDFPELLAYYINKKNYKTATNPVPKTPLDLLNENANAKYTNNLDYKGKWLAAATINVVKNAVSSVTDIKKTALKWTRRFGNGFGGRVNFIRSVLEKFANTNADSGSSVKSSRSGGEDDQGLGGEPWSQKSENSYNYDSGGKFEPSPLESGKDRDKAGAGAGKGWSRGWGKDEIKEQEEPIYGDTRPEDIEELKRARIENKASKRKFRNGNGGLP